MKFLPRCFLSLLLLYGNQLIPNGFCWAVEEKGEEKSVSLDLKQAILFAIHHSPDFDNLTRNFQVAQWQEQSASVHILPTLDLTSKSGFTTISPSNNGHEGVSELSLGFTEVIYDNGVSHKKLRIARLNKTKSELEYKDQRAKLALDIITQFLDYSLKVKLVEIQERQLVLVNKEFAMVSKDYHQGIKTKKDFLRFKTYPIRRELDVIQKKIEASDSLKALHRIIGVGLDNKPAPSIVIADLESPFDIPVKMPLSLENHRQYEMAQIEKKMNQLEVDIVDRRRLPEWFLNAGMSYATDSYLGTRRDFGDNGRYGWEANLILKYNFLDWGTRSRDTEIKKQEQILADNKLDTELLKLQATLRQLDSTLGELRQAITLSKEWVTLESANIEYIGREYRNGKVQYLDLIAGLNDLSAAQEKFYNVSAQLQTTVYSALYHQGLLYDTLFPP